MFKYNQGEQTMKVYKVYAKALINNPGNETSYVCSVLAANKKAAVFIAMNMPENRHFYKLDSYIATS